MSALEVKLNTERIDENAVSHVVQIVREFYDADCVLVLSVNLQTMTTRCIHKTHRHSLKQSIFESLLVPGSPEMLRELMQARAFVPINIQAFASSYEEFVSAGMRFVVAAPYGVTGEGFIVVCNPKKYSSFGTLLQFASYAITVELSNQRNRQKLKPRLQTQHELMMNEVYVKLLDGFELHTKTDILTEQRIDRKQGVVFLALLLFQRGRFLSFNTLLESLWENPDALSDPERILRNLGYSVRKNIGHLFENGDFLDIQKTGFSINRKYAVTTDIDRFVSRIREADGISDSSSKLEHYIEALKSFNGIVLPRHNGQAVHQIASQYDRKRIDVQNTVLALMFHLKQFERMSDLINEVSASRGKDRELLYWDVKSKIGLQRMEEAKAVFRANKKFFAPVHLEELYGIV